MKTMHILQLLQFLPLLQNTLREKDTFRRKRLMVLLWRVIWEACHYTVVMLVVLVAPISVTNYRYLPFHNFCLQNILVFSLNLHCRFCQVSVERTLRYFNHVKRRYSQCLSNPVSFIARLEGDQLLHRVVASEFFTIRLFVGVLVKRIPIQQFLVDSLMAWLLCWTV